MGDVNYTVANWRPMSLKTVAYLQLVLLTPVVTMSIFSKIYIDSGHTNSKCATGVNDPCGKFAASAIETGVQQYETVHSLI